MQVKVLGSGCANCHNLQDRANSALRELGAEGSAELITDLAVIAGYGVMHTPALVVDEAVVVSGRVPSVTDLVTLISEARE